MPILPPIRKGQRLDASFFGRIIDALNFVLNLSVGPGLQLTRTSGGWSLWVDRQEGGGGGGTSEDCTGGVLHTLDFAQATEDTDAWARADDVPVAVKVITDIEYDAVTSFVLGYRTRLMTFDRCGKLSSIGAESAIVPIEEAESC
jgi:hypothetical protein